jgi:nucleoside-diphosphate-sugar epimerase
LRVLVTGATGFLGRHVLDALQQRGVPVVALGRSAPRHPAVDDFLAADLLAREPTAEFLARARATHLLHLAWVATPGVFWSSPMNLRWTYATARLVEAFCAAGGRHVVAAGTCAEYDARHACCREDATPLEPGTLYGAAKDAARRLCQALCTSNGARFAWARIFLTYGAGEDPRRLVPSLHAALTGRLPPFAVDADARRDFLHASDVAQALVALLQHDAGGAFNVCSGRPVRIAEIVRHLAALLGRDPDVVLAASPPGAESATTTSGDNRRLRALGWVPRLDLPSGLAASLPAPADIEARSRRGAAAVA